MSLNGTEVREPRVWVFEIGKRIPDLQSDVEQKGAMLLNNIN